CFCNTTSSSYALPFLKKQHTLASTGPWSPERHQQACGGRKKEIIRLLWLRPLPCALRTDKAFSVPRLGCQPALKFWLQVDEAKSHRKSTHARGILAKGAKKQARELMNRAFGRDACSEEGENRSFILSFCCLD